MFDKLLQVLVFGCGYRKVADAACSATTLRDRRDQWIALGVFARLELLVLAAFDRMVGLELGDLAVDGCITKAPCGGQHAGRSPVDRGKQGRKRSTVTEARGIPLGAVSAGANIHCDDPGGGCGEGLTQTPTGVVPVSRSVGLSCSHLVLSWRPWHGSDPCPHRPGAWFKTCRLAAAAATCSTDRAV